MPVTPTYPGVYIEELPSGVHTITGVATSIAAFIGWAPQGPTDHAQLVLSWPDYSRQFGGLDARSYLGYAVYDFFVNGGQQAYIIRLVDTTSVNKAAVATLTLTGPSASTLVVNAVSPGLWGNNYGIVIKNPTTAGRFRLQVADISVPASPVIVESFESLSMSKTDSRYVQSVINGQSSFITVQASGANAPTDNTATTPPPGLTGGLDGAVLTPGSTTGAFENALTATGAGFNFLERVDLFNLLCVPGEGDPATLSTLEQFCHDHRAMLIIDSESTDTFSSLQTAGGPNSSLTAGDNAANAAFYFPWINAPDPQQNNATRAFPPCGFVAGIYARIDGTRGVWKAPAIQLTDQENGFLNPVAINCIRNFNVYGTVVWGARTCQGNDQLGSQWKYVPVRRMALFIEESLFRALKWVVFEPNDEPLWAQVRLNVGAFMQTLFRQGAFQGKTPADAYFVKCDKETTTQNDINLGIVNIVVGFAPLKPAEFVIIQIQQMAGQIAT
jgi:uncharacterized protein